jgi:glycosyltransferase involved in cell wall biosynthesis
MENKKISIVCPDLGGGGAEKVALLLSNYLAEKNDVSLIVFTLKNQKFLKYVSKKVKLVDLELNRKNPVDFFKIIFKLRRYIKKSDIIISGFQLFTEFITLISSLFLDVKKVAVIQIYITTLLNIKKLNNFLVKFIIKELYKKFDSIICASYGIKEDLTKNFNLKNEKIKVIYNPLYYFEDEEEEEFNYERPVFISIGRLNYQKRFDILITAFKKFYAEFKKGSLIILGEGEDKENLIRIAKDLNIEHKVYFLGFKRNIRFYLKQSDFFVLTSDFEGFGNVIIEAMACGLPVIATDCESGPREILKNGKYGLLAKKGNFLSVYSKMKELYLNKKASKKYEKKALKRAEKFELERIMNEYEKALSKL